MKCIMFSLNEGPSHTTGKIARLEMHFKDKLFDASVEGSAQSDPVALCTEKQNRIAVFEL